MESFPAPTPVYPPVPGVTSPSGPIVPAAPAAPPAPSPVVPALPPVASPGEGGNALERVRGLLRPLLIIAVVVLIGFGAVSLLFSSDLSKLPLIGGLFGRSGDVTLTYWGLWEDPDVI